MRALAIGLIALAASAALPSPVGAAALQVGEAAPDFALRDQSGKLVRLGDFRGKSNVILAFYVMAFTPG